MEITLTASILRESDTRFTAWINEIRGVVAQGESIEEVKRELFKMLKIKLEIERKDSLLKLHEGVISETYNLIA